MKEVRIPVNKQPMQGFVYARKGYEYKFWPYEEVALLREEGTGRLEVTSASGEVAHLVEPLAPFIVPPFVQVSPGVLVNPAFVRRSGGALRLPGGWSIPFEGRLPRAGRPAPEPYMEGTRIRRSDVLGIDMVDKVAYWKTASGDVPCGCTARDAIRLHGDIIRINFRFFNRRRIRTVWEGAGGAFFLFVDGHKEHVSQLVDHRDDLGLPARRRKEKRPRSADLMFTLGLRDFPFELMEASAETLHELFQGDAYQLIANVVWQAVRLRKLGRQLTYGITLRAFWYRPLLPILVRAAHTVVATLSGHPRQLGRRYESMALYLLYLRVCNHLVYKYRLMSFADLGFEDHRPDTRAVGTTHPEIVIVSEKSSLLPFLQQLGERLGVSWQVHNGQPKLTGTEFLSSDLRQRGINKVRVIAYVDYDYSGWLIARAYVRQLARYGIEVSSLVQVVTPNRFSKKEIADLSHKIVTRTRGNRTKLAQWIAAGGGIDGKAIGIYANHLLPYARVEAIVAELAGLKPVPETALA